jgi:predicted transcriptional regulator
MAETTTIRVTTALKRELERLREAMQEERLARTDLTAAQRGALVMMSEVIEELLRTRQEAKP